MSGSRAVSSTLNQQGPSSGRARKATKRVIQDSDEEDDDGQADFDDDDDDGDFDGGEDDDELEIAPSKARRVPSAAMSKAAPSRSVSAKSRVISQDQENDFDPDASMRSDASRKHKLAKQRGNQKARRSLQIAAAFQNAGGSHSHDTSMTDVSTDSITRQNGAINAMSQNGGSAPSSSSSRATAGGMMPPPPPPPRLNVLARAGATVPGSLKPTAAGTAPVAGLVVPPVASGSNVLVASAAALAAAAAAAPARIRVDTTSFEEWMKMATDNKINSTNTWSFALIDYFHDMSLLRSESGDGTINFQKASCTLDGCVKVWTSRVDSVVVETGRLLSGLQDDARPGRKDDDGEGDGHGSSDEDGDDVDGADGEGGTGPRGGKGKRKRNKEITLAKHFSQIKAKNFDLEFTVDPLFKKTSADFDEGGAGGLLMNHLGVDGRMRVVFDASDVAGVDEVDDEDEEGADAQADTEAAQALREADQIDIGKLQAKLFGVPEEHATNQVPHLAAMLNRRHVCPSLRMFKFDREDKTSFAEFLHRAAEADMEMEDEDAVASGFGGANFEEGPNFMDIDAPLDANNFGDDENMDFLGAPEASGSRLNHDQGNETDEEDAPPAGPQATDDDAPEVDAFADLDLAGADNYEMPPMDQDGGLDEGAGYNDYGVGGDADEVDGAGPSRPQPFVRPDEHDILMALNTGLADSGGSGPGRGDDEDDGEGGGAGAGRNVFDYFDQRFMKNWAGPEHWKMRRVTPIAGTALAAASYGAKDEGNASSTKPARKPKEAFAFVFSVDDAPDPKQLFATSSGRGAASITLPKQNPKSKAREQFLLPEDQHYNSKQLLKLFVKPKVTIQMRRRGVAVVADDDLMGLGAAAGLDQIDDVFWVQQAAERDQIGEQMGGNDMYDDFDAMGGMPFDDADDIGVGGEDGAAQLELVRRVKPQMVNYAKKASRVDIRKLKENIWKELGIHPYGAIDVDKTPEANAGESAESANGKRFAQVLGGLRTTYPKEKMEEISTSFCFICLLHLANEEGLQISLGKDGDAGNVIQATPEDDALGEDDEDGEEAGRDGEDEEMESVFGSAKSLSRAQRDQQEEARRVGQLEQLLIVKDPTAGRSA
ncbi:hypothetical protein OC846_004546 [Tilletia horrida]|uniref:Condensin complex subunit 2 n=1 Tax=Tilletia horrida TaxID=155126 RepID=A0AAN6GMD7_9BASI|nr:hypothetical protein OC846_004546 [Tilletia horrida]